MMRLTIYTGRTTIYHSNDECDPGMIPYGDGSGGVLTLNGKDAAVHLDLTRDEGKRIMFLLTQAFGDKK